MQMLMIMIYHDITMGTIFCILGIKMCAQIRGNNSTKVSSGHYRQVSLFTLRIELNNHNSVCVIIAAPEMSKNQPL